MSLAKKAEQLHEAGHYDEADRLFGQVLEQDPQHPGRMFNRARKLCAEGDIPGAILQYCDVLTAPGEYPVYRANAANNLGILLLRNGKKAEAIKAFEFALSLIPNFAPAHSNIGNVLLVDGDHEAAMKQYTTALKFDGKCYDAMMNCGSIQLLTGDMKRGWENYERRWDTKGFATIPIRNTRKRWKGQPLGGKTLLLTGEQGCGDAIQFIRYAPMIRDRYKPQSLRYHGHWETVKLFGHLKGGLDDISCVKDPNDIPEGEYDYHCPLLSLPAIFGTRLHNIPSETYLDVPGSFGLPDNGRMKVGIAWAGAPRHMRDKERSISADTLDPLSTVKDVDFYSIQVGAGRGACPGWAEDLAPRLACYTDTARALREMDLLISVDTSVVHLAGAIGTRCWMLTPYVNDWRWLLGREDSPWYPKMRLFRQSEKGRWDDVVERIRSELVADHENRRVPGNAER